MSDKRMTATNRVIAGGPRLRADTRRQRARESHGSAEYKGHQAHPPPSTLIPANPQNEDQQDPRRAMEKARHNTPKLQPYENYVAESSKNTTLAG